MEDEHVGEGEKLTVSDSNGPDSPRLAGWGGGAAAAFRGISTPSYQASMRVVENVSLFSTAEALNVHSPQSSLVRRLSAKKRVSKSESKSVLIATKAVRLETRGAAVRERRDNG